MRELRLFFLVDILREKGLFFYILVLREVGLIFVIFMEKELFLDVGLVLDILRGGGGRVSFLYIEGGWVSF